MEQAVCDLSVVSILNDLTENRPLYKDSGLWQIRTDNMKDVICQQEVNESFEDFIKRYKVTTNK